MAITIVGTVSTLIGSAFAIDDKGFKRPLKAGDKLYANEVVETADQSAIEIRLNNGNRLDLGRTSELTLDSELLDSVSASADTQFDVDAVQAAIEAGQDPTTISEPPAAGPVDENDGSDIVRVEYGDPQATPESGFETAGINSPQFEQPLVDFLLDPDAVRPTAGGSGSATPVDQVPMLSIDDVMVTEGDPFVSNATITFTVTRSFDNGIDTIVEYGVNPGSAVAGAGFTGDYSGSLDPLNGNITFGAGELTKTINLDIIDDFSVEETEQFTVSLINPANGVINKGIGIGTILDTDVPEVQNPQPSLSINDVTVTEGDPFISNATITFTVTRSSDNGTDTTVQYGVNPGSAVEGSGFTGDYSGSLDPLNGNITFGAGELSKTITLDIIDDFSVEETEQFTVSLINPANGVINKGIGIGTILDTDVPEVGNPQTSLLSENIAFSEEGTVFNLDNKSFEQIDNFDQNLDTLNISDIITEYSSNNSAIEDFIQIETDGQNASVKVDSNGPLINGTDFSEVAIITGITSGQVNIQIAENDPVVQVDVM